MEFIHKSKLIKSVGLVGFGKSNRGVFEYLRASFPDLIFTVRDMRLLEELPRDVRTMTGNDCYRDLNEDIFFISPGIRRDVPELSGCLLSSDAELFFEKKRDCVFGITGTDGKSTTTALAARLAEAFAIGNIGEAMSAHINDGGGARYAAELSSFQLMDIRPRLTRALITNIKPNHLNWHKSLEEYIHAKENITRNTQEAVFSLDSPLLRDIMRRKAPFAVFSCELCEDEILGIKAELHLYIKNGAIYMDGKRLSELSEHRRKERYNISNFMAAAALTYGYWTPESLSETAKEFSGLPHRFELLYTKSGIPCYNSSIDSSPDRVLASLKEYSHDFVLLMGGRTKNANFEILLPELQKKAVALVLTGENRGEIRESLQGGLRIPIYTEGDFSGAVMRSLSLADKNHALIFSPASTSFDSFESFEERGNVFKKLIKSAN